MGEAFIEGGGVVAVIGLGYVGLPLAAAFGTIRPTIGFDIKADRIEALRRGHDATLETTEQELRSATLLTFTSDPAELVPASIFIVTVPTPIDDAKQPDLGALEAASRTVGRVLRRGALVIYESTVYPGATEEVCVPILESESGLALNVDFHVGYSPERINPGDHEHRLANILKVTSGSSAHAANVVDDLYQSIITAGTHKAPSIRVAEAAKIIENTQRDVNIALINELAILFDTLGIDTNDVLTAAGTKWNFLPFRPGLVGGHCIGVDPYYLTHKAQQVGHHPEMILAGRHINDAMGTYVAERVVLLMAARGISLAGARVLVLGLAFKANCPDLRNTHVVDVIAHLRQFGVTVEVCDPWVDPMAAHREYDLDLVGVATLRGRNHYDAVIHAVAHHQFADLAPQVRADLGDDGIIFDISATWPREFVDGRL